MKLATFNIYWLGGEKIKRKDSEENKIGQTIAKVDADVIGFQEVIRAEDLQRIIDHANVISGRNYQIKNESGEWLSPNSKYMRTAIAYDQDKVELKQGAEIKGLHFMLRKPYVVHVIDNHSGAELDIIAVHLQSGNPEFDNDEDAQKRTNQCVHLADWISGNLQDKNPDFPKPTSENQIVLGDFNALNDLNISNVAFDIQEPKVSYDSLEPLRQGVFADWHWPAPKADPDGGGQFSVYGEKLLIDFIMFSPQLKDKISKQPEIYAFDLDPEIGIADKRISDHRPVVAELTFS